MRAHPLNIGYLVVGLVFLGLAGSWALREAGVVDADGMRWALPVTLVLAGAAGLLASAGRAFRRGAAEVPPASPETGVDEPASTYRYDDPVQGPGGTGDAEVVLAPEPAGPISPAVGPDIAPDPRDPIPDPSPDPTSDTTKDETR